MSNFFFLFQPRFFLLHIICERLDFSSASSFVFPGFSWRSQSGAWVSGWRCRLHFILVVDDPLLLYEIDFRARYHDPIVSSFMIRFSVFSFPAFSLCTCAQKFVLRMTGCCRCHYYIGVPGNYNFYLSYSFPSNSLSTSDLKSAMDTYPSLSHYVFQSEFPLPLGFSC